MGEILKKVLGKSFTKVTTWVALLVTFLGLFADHIVPVLGMFIGDMDPKYALVLGALVTWAGRLRGILEDVKKEMESA